MGTYVNFFIGLKTITLSTVHTNEGPFFQRLLVLELPSPFYINYCANGFLCYAVLCKPSAWQWLHSAVCPLVVKSWKLLNSFDMILRWKQSVGESRRVISIIITSSLNNTWRTSRVRQCHHHRILLVTDSYEREKHQSNCQVFSSLL